MTDPRIAGFAKSRSLTLTQEAFFRVLCAVLAVTKLARFASFHAHVEHRNTTTLQQLQHHNSVAQRAQSRGNSVNRFPTLMPRSRFLFHLWLNLSLASCLTNPTPMINRHCVTRKSHTRSVGAPITIFSAAPRICANVNQLFCSSVRCPCCSCCPKHCPVAATNPTREIRSHLEYSNKAQARVQAVKLVKI